MPRFVWVYIDLDKIHVFGDWEEALENFRQRYNYIGYHLDADSNLYVTVALELLDGPQQTICIPHIKMYGED